MKKEEELPEYNSEEDLKVAQETKLRGKKGAQEARNLYLKDIDFK